MCLTFLSESYAMSFAILRRIKNSSTFIPCSIPKLSICVFEHENVSHVKPLMPKVGKLGFLGKNGVR